MGAGGDSASQLPAELAGAILKEPAVIWGGCVCCAQNPLLFVDN